VVHVKGNLHITEGRYTSTHSFRCRYNTVSCAETPQPFKRSKRRTNVYIDTTLHGVRNVNPALLTHNISVWTCHSDEFKDL